MTMLSNLNGQGTDFNPEVNMKCLFLDIDGVLSPDGVNGTPDNLGGYFSPRCVYDLNEWLIANPDVEVVLSSSWRNLPGVDATFRTLRDVGLVRRPYDVTPYWETQSGWGGRAEEASRGHTVARWLLQHPECSHGVVLDDSHLSDMKPIARWTVQVSPRTGFVKRLHRRMDKVLKDPLPIGDARDTWK